MLQQQISPFPNTRDETLDTCVSFNQAKEGLTFLIKRYTEDQNKSVAAKIAFQLEMILKHHSDKDFPPDRCAFYRLIRFWRMKSL